MAHADSYILISSLWRLTTTTLFYGHYTGRPALAGTSVSHTQTDHSNPNCHLTHGPKSSLLLIGWQEGHPACKKTEWWGAGVVISLQRDADLHMSDTTQLMPLPLTVSCFSKIQIDGTFLVPAHLGSPGQRAIKWVCCVCVIKGEEPVVLSKMMLA